MSRWLVFFSQSSLTRVTRSTFLCAGFCFEGKPHRLNCVWNARFLRKAQVLALCTYGYRTVEEPLTTGRMHAVFSCIP